MTTLSSSTPSSRRAIADEVMRAAGYKLITPADLPSKPKPAPDHEATVRTRWSPRKKAAFDALEPIALVLLATDGPVSVVLHEQGKPAVRMGHNRGIWPAKIARTTSWRDTVTANHDKNPFMFLGAQARLWVDSEVAARAGMVSLVAKLAEMDHEHGELSGRLRHGFTALDPEIDLDLFAEEMKSILQRATNGHVWDDDGLSDHLDAMVARTIPKAPKAGRRGA